MLSDADIGPVCSGSGAMMNNQVCEADQMCTSFDALPLFMSTELTAPGHEVQRGCTQWFWLAIMVYESVQPVAANIHGVRVHLKTHT